MVRIWNNQKDIYYYHGIIRNNALKTSMHFSIIAVKLDKARLDRCSRHFLNLYILNILFIVPNTMQKVSEKRGKTLLIGKRIFKNVTATVLSLAVIFTVSAGSVPAKASSLNDLKQKQTALQQKGQELDAQIQKLKNDKAQQQQYKDALEAKSVNLEQQIDSKNIQISQLDADILQKQKSIAGKEKNIAANFDKLKQRVYALYLTGEASDLEVILNAKNIMDLADKAEILKVVSEHDTKLINTLKTELNCVKAQKEAIERNRKTVSDAKASLEQDHQQLTTLSEECAKMIASLGQNQQDAETAKSNNIQAQQEVKASVNQWLAEYIASQKNSTNSNSSNQNTETNNHSSRGAISAGSVSAMISEAEKYIGYPYVWGGSNPQTSFDCSGFVSWVINHSGWDVGRLGVDGLYSLCTPVSSSAVCPGDLVFYNYTYDGLPRSHVGIYIGNGNAIQCDDPGVEIISLSSSYWQGHFDSFGRLP